MLRRALRLDYQLYRHWPIASQSCLCTHCSLKPENSFVAELSPDDQEACWSVSTRELQVAKTYLLSESKCQAV
jgi:hypothetical protein